MATPWENVETITNGKALEKQAKLWIAPQSFKSWWKITDNIIGFYTLMACHCEYGSKRNGHNV
jgi:hypothetical protein